MLSVTRKVNMSKIFGQAKIKSVDGEQSLEIKGIKSENKITYLEDQIMVTILLFPSRIELRRMYSDYSILLSFEKELTTKGIYDIKGDGMLLDLSIFTLVLKQEEHHIYIRYRLEENIFEYELTYQEVE